MVTLERTNISDLSGGRFDPPPVLATVDLSYLSLKKAIPAIASLLAPGGELVCLVKPLFEVEDSEVRRPAEVKSWTEQSLAKRPGCSPGGNGGHLFAGRYSALLMFP